MAGGREQNGCRRGILSALDPRGFLGFTLFLAWFNCTFFSCLFVTNLCMNLSSERYWGLAMLVSAITAFLLLTAGRKRGFVLDDVVTTIAAGAMSTVGTLFIYLGFFFDDLIFELILTGAILTGIGITTFMVRWAGAIEEYSGDCIEFIVPASYAVSIIIYFILVYSKTPIAVGIAIGLPAISSFLLAKLGAHKGPDDAPKMTARWPRELTDGMARGCIALLVLWMNFAYFRSFSAPDYPSNRLTHYIGPFVTALVISIIIFFFIYKSASSITLTLAYRIALPFIIAGYAIAPLLHGQYRELAYTLSFAAMIIMQLYLWIVPIKQARKYGLELITPFASILISTGIGAAVGILLGILTRTNLDPELRLTTAPLMGAFVVLVMMATGFSPHTLSAKFVELDRAQARKLKGLPGENDVDHPDPLDIGDVTRAGLLAEAFDLTSRETDVLLLLLQGRDRPSMRDELQISINTVSTHIRNIYRKLDIHDRQQLIDLAQESVETFLDEQGS